MSDGIFTSGPWTGFYSYSSHHGRHRQDLKLEFGKGRITGEGSDGLGLFVIDGHYDLKSNEVHWCKSYVGAHSVFYTGVRQGKGIRGTWEIGAADRGGFRIWPLASGSGDDNVVTEEREQPIDAVAVVVGGGAESGPEYSVREIASDTQLAE